MFIAAAAVRRCVFLLFAPFDMLLWLFEGRRPSLWLVVAALAACSSPADQITGLDPTPKAVADLATAAAVAPNLVVVELMADPSKVGDASGEYVKLYNPGPVAVNLQSYTLQSAVGTIVYTGSTSVESHTILSSVLVPVGTCVVLGNNISALSNGGITTEPYSYGGSITLGNNATDWVTIKTPTGVLLDSVAYSTSTINTTVTPRTRTLVPPQYTVVTGIARSLVDPSVDNTVMAGTNWQNATMTYGSGDKGTPNDCQYTWRSDGAGDELGPLDHVTISGATSVTVGGTTQLSASAQDANNRPISTAAFSWSSSNESIATVDATGKVTGVALSASPDTITVTATSDGITKTGERQVMVTAKEIHWIDVSSSSASFPPGFQTQLFATARTAQTGDTITSTFTFEALDPQLATIATVSNTGIITAIAPPTDGTTKPQFRVSATPVGGGASYSFVARPIAVEIPAFAPTSIYAKNDEFGDPTAASASNPNDLLIARSQYTLSYNESRGTPNWVSYELDARQMVAGQDRCNCFTADPRLPADKQIFTSDYTNGGYDRGHMARSADRSAANGDNAVTFYLTNIVPQTSNLNQGVWAQFENALADSASKGGRAVYIITGPLYSRSHDLTFLKNEGKVAIPDSTWKVAFIGPRSGVPFDRNTIQTWGDLAGTTVLAVNMPNVTGVRDDPWSKYLTTVDKIEAATGYDFLSLLPVAFQTAIEAGDRPPVASFTIVGTRNEGSALTFDASASTDPDLGRTDLDRPEGLTYVWSFSDGSTPSGMTPTKTFANNGTYTATLIVSDAYGWERAVSQPVTIANVAPKVAAFDGATLLRGETYAVSGRFTDPGTDTWSATANYGDETGNQSLALDGKTFQLGHTYASAGTFTVTVSVDDGDATGSSMTTVVVETPLQGIGNLADALASLGSNRTLGKGEINSLRAKLNAAEAQLRRGNTTPCVNVLGAFINELEALVKSGRLSSSAAAPMLSYAERVIRSVTA
jgi:DNA/RNA endonuclease G (NUC1)